MASSTGAATSEAVQVPSLEEGLEPVPEAPWVREDEPTSGEERPRPRAEAGAGAALSGGRRRRRAWEPSGGALIAPRPSRNPASAVTRGVATAGAVGIATAVAAVMGAAGSAGWLIGLVASLLTLALVMLVSRASV
jgi:hypothetical protein